jgi:hypothetical protein
MKLINKWQSLLELTDWSFPIEAISSDQVMYDDDCPIEDRYFIGVEIDIENKIGTIHHDRELKEADVIHELLHVRYPEKSEKWVNEIESLLSIITR